MKTISRRNLLKAAGGLVAFLPVIRHLAQSSSAAADCGCPPPPPPPIYGPPPPGYNRCDQMQFVFWRMRCINGFEYREFVGYDAFDSSYCANYLQSTGNGCIGDY